PRREGDRRRSGPPGRARVRDDPVMASSTELAVTAEFAGVVVAIRHGADEQVGAGTPLIVLEAMKMEHEVIASTDGIVRRVAVSVGDAVEEGRLLLVLEPGGAAADDGRPARRPAASGPATERADLAAVRERHEIGLDPARPDAVARRRERGQRTARENLDDLLDED